MRPRQRDGRNAADERLQEVRDGFATLLVMGAGAPEPVFAISDLDADGVPVRVYRPTPEPTDWRISPHRSPDLRGVAPAVVTTAEDDPLRDEGQAYARRLEGAGVSVTHIPYDGMIHAFFGLSAAFDASRDALQRVSAELRQAFGTLSN